MKLPIWVHQLSTSYGQSQLPGDDNLIPADAIWGKAADGMDWMSNFDSHPNAIGSLQDCRDRDTMHGQDLVPREWKPWVVPHGALPGEPFSYAAREGTMHGRIAAAGAGAGAGEVPTLILDLEPASHGGSSPQFWRNDLMGSEQDAYIDAYMDAVRAAAGDAVDVWLSVDARSDFTDQINFRTWWGRDEATLVLPQSYWTTFQRSWSDTLHAMQMHLNARGVPNESIATTMPGDSSGDDFLAAMDWLHTGGFARPNVFQRVNLTPAAADVLEAHTDPWAADPAPPPPEPAYDREGAIEHARNAQAEIVGVLSDLGAE